MRIVHCALVAILLVPGLARSEGAIRITAAISEWHGPDDLGVSDLGWIGSIEARPKEKWPYLGLGFGLLPLSNQSIGLWRFGVTTPITVRGDGGGVGIQIVAAGGVQWTRFPNLEQPLTCPDCAMRRDPSDLTGFSPYAGLGLDLSTQLNPSSRLALYGGVTGTRVDGATHTYPTVGVAVRSAISSW